MQRPSFSFLKTIKPEAQILIATFAGAYACGFMAASQYQEGYENGGAFIAALGYGGIGRIGANGLNDRYGLYTDHQRLEKFLLFDRILNTSGLVLGALTNIVLHSQQTRENAAIETLVGVLAVAGITSVAYNYRSAMQAPEV